ncbi:MAG TPA: SET domain-containing protein [Patescibacteria group bacterium]|nr:SET domain-containing protein [Patescibacteria group bacterium]
MEIPFSVGISPTLKIRGLIASRDIKTGEILEKCPIILVELKGQEEFLKKTVLWRYYFEWTAKYHAIVLGYGSLYNHSYSPNVRYDMDYKNQVMVYRAIKDIKNGEEVTINYNWDPGLKDPIDEFLIDFDSHKPVKK